VEPVGSSVLADTSVAVESVAGGSVVSPAVVSESVVAGSVVAADVVSGSVSRADVAAVLADDAAAVVLAATVGSDGDAVLAESSLAHAASTAPAIAAHTITPRSLCIGPVYEASPGGCPSALQRVSRPNLSWALC